MKTDIQVSRDRLLLGGLLVVLLFLYALVYPVSADIPVTVDAVGQTYIQWNWTEGLDLTDMYIDGNVVCGYETTSPWYLLTDLDSNSSHTIQIFTATDLGNNTAWTTNCTVDGSCGAGAYQMPETPLEPAIAIIAVIATLFIISRRRE